MFCQRGLRSILRFGIPSKIQRQTKSKAKQKNNQIERYYFAGEDRESFSPLFL